MLLLLVIHWCLVFVISIARCQIEDGFLKCCAENEGMTLNEGSYVCGVDSKNNWDIVNNGESTNVSEYYCVEVFEGAVYVFERLPLEFTKLFLIEVGFYRKCCPLGFVYNSLKHSCEENANARNNISRFVRVGLPHCRIVLDFKLHHAPATFTTFTADDYCIDSTPDHLEVIRVCTEDFDVCSSTKCIHKCCPDGHSFVNGSFCLPTYTHGVDLNFSESIEQNEDFAVIHGYKGKIYLQPLSWQFRLDNEGIFRFYDEQIGEETYEPNQETYCIEHATKKGVDFGHRLFRKYPEQQIEEKFIINGYVMIVSSIFLVLTVLIYICSGETKKLFGKTLVSFCICLLLTFLVLIYSTFNLDAVKENDYMCHGFGFLLLYGEFGTFLWLKLLCFDIYYTFGSGKVRNKSTSTSLKRFLFYSLYGWGLSLLLTIIPLILFHVDILPDPISITIGEYRCAIDRVDGNYADLLFRTVPVTIIQMINVGLFVKTVKCCMDVKNEIRKINDNHDAKKFLVNKERFVLVIKLSVIMGISYVFEVASSFYDFNRTKPTKYLEIVWDIVNCLQGVFIFVIFICKKKMAVKLKLQAGVQKLRKISFSSGTTLTTHLSIDKEKKKVQSS